MTVSSFSVGIDALHVSVPRHALAVADLARARGVDPAKFERGLGCGRIAVPAADEDAVTLAVSAAAQLLRTYAIDPGSIGLVVVGSESGVDASKPIAAWIHRFLGLGERCRSFDVQHACYGATAALGLACDWSRARPGRLALVLATDIARYEIGSPGESTQGAGALAMLVSRAPRILALDEGPESTYTREVMDFWRPPGRATAMVDGKLSIEAYLTALQSTYAHWRRSSGESLEALDHALFHVPFPKMALKAQQRLARLDADATEEDAAVEARAQARFARQTAPSLWGNVELGNVYTGSLWLSLAGLLERGAAGVAGERVGLFSYGSGSGAEWLTARIGADAEHWAGRIGLAAGLEQRVALSVSQYEALRTAYEARGRQVLDGDTAAAVELRTALPPGARLSFRGLHGERRIYSAEAATAA